MKTLRKEDISQEVFDLYDDYAHNRIDRRQFINKLSAYAVGGITVASLLGFIMPRYSETIQLQPDDPRLESEYITYNSPKGGGEIKALLSRPAGTKEKLPGIIVVHENRGLNPHIEDVARRAALAGFVSLAPDALTPLGGYPGNDDDGKVKQKSLDQDKLFTDLLNSAIFLKGHELSNGKLGATGFCYGGGVVNNLAVKMGTDLNAGVPFYGRAPATDDVTKIQAPLMIQYAKDDPRVNATRDEYRKALENNKKDFVMYTYEGTRHGFHNNSTPRYNEEQAKIAWERTISFFKKQLS